MFQRRRSLSLFVAAALAASMLGPVCFAQAPALSPVEPGWRVIGDIAEGEDISGIACVRTGGQVRRCVIAVDEKVSAVLATIDGRTIRQDGTLKLIEKVKGEELDAEAVAYDSKANAFYVIGSHGRKRTCCKDNPSSFNLIRVPIDPSTGRLDPDDRSGMAPAAWIAPPNILPAMQRSPQLAKRANACLGTKPPRKKGKVVDCDFNPGQGANIEGIAILGDTVFLGFRGPVDGNTAYLLAFDRNSLFEPQLRNEVTIPIKLGPGQGVRDLAAVADGLLVLSGPEDDEPGQAALHRFDAKTQAITLLGTLAGLPRKAKPEALLVLSEDAPAYQVLVLSDGVPNGSPLEYKVPK
jgi:Protein of unknown function (DUF3616)